MLGTSDGTGAAAAPHEASLIYSLSLSVFDFQVLLPVLACHSDFLPTMPKVHLDRALEVFYLYSAQKSVINISLSAIGLLWNATDLLGRSRAAAAAAAATAAAAAAAAATQAANKAGGVIGGLLSALSMSRVTLSEEAAAVLAAEKEAAAAAVVARSNSSSSSFRRGEEGASDPHVAGRSDLSEAECVELLLKLFTHLRKISMDTRPEVGGKPDKRVMCHEQAHHWS